MRRLHKKGYIEKPVSKAKSILFTVDNKGNGYNKNFFDEGKFPGAMTALLKSEPSEFTIEALEDSADCQGLRCASAAGLRLRRGLVPEAGF